MKIRNLVIGAVGLMSLGAFGCGAQGGTENTGKSADAVFGASYDTIATMPAAVKFAASCAISDTEMLVAGGYNSADAAISSVYLYNVATNSWTTKASLPSARGQAIMVRE